MPQTIAEKARKQRQTPRYKEWRAAYEKTEKYKSRVLAYHRKRRADPLVQPKLKENARRYLERYRIGALIRHAISRCKKTGISCDAEYLRSRRGERPETCPCCGVKFDYSYSGRVHHPIVNGPSLDRVDPALGYVPGNVEIICWRCNALKRDGTLEEFESIARYMKRFLIDQRGSDSV